MGKRSKLSRRSLIKATGAAVITSAVGAMSTSANPVHAAEGDFAKALAIAQKSADVSSTIQTLQAQNYGVDLQNSEYISPEDRPNLFVLMPKVTSAPKHDENPAIALDITIDLALNQVNGLDLRTFAADGKDEIVLTQTVVIPTTGERISRIAHLSEAHPSENGFTLAGVTRETSTREGVEEEEPPNLSILTPPPEAISSTNSARPMSTEACCDKAGLNEQFCNEVYIGCQTMTCYHNASGTILWYCTTQRWSHRCVNRSWYTCSDACSCCYSETTNDSYYNVNVGGPGGSWIPGC